MNLLLAHSELHDLHPRVAAGEPLSRADGERLFASRDLHGLAALANLVCERHNGRHASYILNRYLNYSNYCILSCQFCAFARKKRDGDGFELTIEEMVGKAREALTAGITELHIVGGLHPSLPYGWYLDLLRALRALDPALRLKCFTAVEVLHLSRLSKRPVPTVLAELREAGLDALTGGGAEIFNPAVRDRIARGKESAEEWAAVHRAWHRLGGRSTCTMLFGHVETAADRVDHLLRLRALQAETGGFAGFIPLPYQPENNGIPVRHAPTGFDTLRTMAVSRLLLDNVPHVTAYWVGMGLKLAQLALSHGADDLHGTIQEEHIFRMAGGEAPQRQTEAMLLKAIREAGRIPVQRDTFYEPLKVWEEPAPDAAAETAPAPAATPS